MLCSRAPENTTRHAVPVMGIYPKEIVYIKRIGTHKEYDKWER
jgi:mRNA-degrading endonuclease HigB of HigAB toxin-antitoxin module